MQRNGNDPVNDGYIVFYAYEWKLYGGIIGDEANIAAVHEFGCTIHVTPKMRAYLHYQGIHLKASTQYIHIPARPFLRPVLLGKEFKAKVAEIYIQAVERMFHS